MIRIVLGCVILAAPLLLFGFGLADWIAPWVLRRATAVRVALPLTLLSGYVVFGGFRWDMFLGMAAVSLIVTGLLENGRGREPGWRDWVVLAVLGLSVDLGFFKSAFPVGGLSGLSKLLFVDVGLYGYLVLRPIGGIGYDFRPRRADFRIGLSEFLLYTPVAIALGFALSFLHLHRTLATPWWFAGGWLFTLIVIAVPEELFFRGLMLNMLERRVGTRGAVAISSGIFGLAHFNKRAAYFNWRYVILAAIAGVFYARAWLVQRRILTSSITHATVDTVWSIWLR